MAEKKHPWKGWRKIGALVLGSGICSVFPETQEWLAPLLKWFIAIQGGADAAESLANGGLFGKK
jgi:hypothetical protein